MTRLMTLFLTVALALSACTYTAQPPAEPTDHYRFIIQFRTPLDDPADTDFVRRLSEDAGATLTYLRTLTTGAHVYRVDSAIDRAGFDELLHKLTLRPDVRYVEEDRRVQPAQPAGSY